MADITPSLPDDLLPAIDAEARRTETTRDAVVTSLVDGALRRQRASRAAAMRSLLSGASSHGGRAAERIKATRS